MNWFRTSVYSFLLATPFMAANSYAQSDRNATLPGLSGQSSQVQRQDSSGGGEHITVRGHRTPPPGYTYAPSMTMEKGPDPEHQRGLAEAKDPVSGANLSRYGTAYRESGPMGRGTLGDSTGNGWLTPR